MNVLSLRKRNPQGFTIVELLIVIVVIAILAAVTVVAYNGISSRAKVANLKTDASNVSKLLQNAATLNGEVYPIDQAHGGPGLSTINNGSPYTPADGTVLAYIAYTPTVSGVMGYCAILFRTDVLTLYTISSDGLKEITLTPGESRTLCGFDSFMGSYSAKFYVQNATLPLSLSQQTGF